VPVRAALAAGALSRRRRLSYGALLDPAVIAVSPLFIAAFMFDVFLLAGGWALFPPPRE